MVERFKKLISEKFYDGTAIHRVDVQLGIIQGGDPNTKGSTSPCMAWEFVLSKRAGGVQRHSLRARHAGRCAHAGRKRRELSVVHPP